MKTGIGFCVCESAFSSYSSFHKSWLVLLTFKLNGIQEGRATFKYFLKWALLVSEVEASLKTHPAIYLWGTWHLLVSDSPQKGRFSLVILPCIWFAWAFVTQSHKPSHAHCTNNTALGCLICRNKRAPLPYSLTFPDGRAEEKLGCWIRPKTLQVHRPASNRGQPDGKPTQRCTLATG